MSKLEKKLRKLTVAAYDCESRKEAQKILRKLDKTRAKLAIKRMIDEQGFNPNYITTDV